MNFPSRRLNRTPLILLCLAAFLFTANGQQKTPEQTQDVVRINAELVQTDVTVLDKQGRFVDDLKPEQFELRVDGKPRPISFFERVGDVDLGDEKQLKDETQAIEARSGARVRTAAERKRAAKISTRGRTIFFFIDDVHLSTDSLMRARQALLEFVEGELGQEDRAAIISTSGQVGFLQQLTGNRAVLRAAIARLGNQQMSEVYAGKVPISEYDAAQVAVGHNHDLFRYLVEATAAEFQSNLMNAAKMVQSRVQQINAQSGAATRNTLSMLERLLQSVAPLPGRKLVFFISDGFVADPRLNNVLDRMQQVTLAAARVGAVIYTMDARGTFLNTHTDATQNLYPDFTGNVSRNLFAEDQATQGPLHILAEDTGGRAILNLNSFPEGFRRALDESSRYYLLAWRPEPEEQSHRKARLAVAIKGRPDLKVRLRRGFIESPANAFKRSDNSVGRGVESPDSELVAALGSLYPARALPVALSVGYSNTQKDGTLLTVSMQLDAAALRSEAEEAKQRTEVDVLGVALDDRGRISSFKQKLKIGPDALSAMGDSAVVWNQKLPLAPGLYQVRVAVRERSSGLTGSAIEWIEIPQLAPDALALSSIFIGERKREELKIDETDAPASIRVPVNVKRLFARTSRLRFETYVYQPTRASTPPDINMQVQVIRNKQAVLTLPQSKLKTVGVADPARIAFSGEVALEPLPPGRYLLKISVINRATGASSSQQVDFTIE
ncbi:MAG TPA: VWA domain-containing protein [Pyrinomonadaceae bacterium]|jgi:VWFA-related protein